VVDCDACELREQLDELCVLLAERLAAGLLGQVKVSERPAGDHHRHSQERLHVRVLGRKAERVRMGADIVQAQRSRMFDQLSEHPPSLRRIADPLPGLRVDPDRQEPLEPTSRCVEHAKRRVPGARQLPRGFDHASEHDIEVEVRENPLRDFQHPAHSGGERPALLGRAHRSCPPES
jgi:hypothetical protein